ncbi:MAG: MarR family winged helix-turn-helix transcriptional regulator [Clostridia bacterium]
MHKNDLGQMFDRRIFSIQKKVKTYLCEGLSPAISMPHIFVMGYIKVHSPCIVTDISNHMEITLSAVTSLLNKLVDMELVVRERSEEDRRIVRVFITSSGEEMLKKVWENKSKLMSKVLQGLSEQELNEYFRIQDMIFDKLAEES